MTKDFNFEMTNLQTGTYSKKNNSGLTLKGQHCSICSNIGARFGQVGKNKQ